MHSCRQLQRPFYSCALGTPDVTHEVSAIPGPPHVLSFGVRNGGRSLKTGLELLQGEAVVYIYCAAS
jgi:hypothetical protein